jgi:beta-glucuronidase
MNRDKTVITNMAGRRANGSVRSLDGTWRIIIDPYNCGYVDIMGERNRHGYYRDFSPRHRGDRVEYDFDTSWTIEVPGDWNTQRPELLFYEGTAWYRRLIEIDEAETGRSFIYLGAVNHTSRVFLDGHELALHEGGFGPWAVEVTGRLGVGTHSLVVMVDNRREPDRIPAMRTDWWNFGGIHRSVELVSVPEVFIRDAWITMAPDGSLIGCIELDGASGDGASGDGAAPWVRVTIGDTGVVADVMAGQRFTIGADLAASIERWNPGAPVLHEVTFELTEAAELGRTVVDSVTDTIGFRTVETVGTDIVVNGKVVWLKGISLHAEGPTGGRRAHGDDDAATLLSWAVDLGANFVRLSHYQHDEAMVKATDRLGLLAWCELPVYWGIDFANPTTLANALDQTNELVERDRNRASVILWSVANETLPGPDRNTFLAALAERARDLDPTRLITGALLTLPSNDPQVHIDDPLGEVVDVIGVNQYMGWYYASRDDLATVEWSSAFGKPIVFSELGAGAKAGHHGEPDKIWTEEFQAAVYDAQIAMIRRQHDCAGMSPWILKDFRTPMRVLPGIQDGYNRKGVVSEEGQRKLAFEVLASFYRSLAG